MDELGVDVQVLYPTIYLTQIGYSVAQTGLLVTIGSAGSAFFAFLIVFIGDTFGRRRLLVTFTLLTGATGMGFALSDQYLLLAITTFFVGSLAISGSGPRGPIQPFAARGKRRAAGEDAARRHWRFAKLHTHRA